MNEKPKNLDLFPIQYVAQITGMNPHTIRAWEKRYQAIKPTRDSQGRRTYKQKDIDRLNLLYDLVNVGHNISQLAGLDETSLKKLKTQSEKLPPDNTLTREGSQKFSIKMDVNSTLQNLLLALHAYKLDIIVHEMEKIREGLDQREFALNIVSPLLREVGVLVARGKLNPAQEHALSAILKYHLGQILFGRYNPKKNKQVQIVFATPEGDRHEFGIMIAALLASYYEHNIFYFGSDLPIEALMDTLSHIRPTHLIMAATYDGNRSNLGHFKNYFKNVGEKLLEKKISIWIGGEIPLKPDEFKDLPNIQFLSTFQILDLELRKLAT